MDIYLVGGAVRDLQLGIEPREKDWVVVGASEQQMLDQGFQKLDATFPVFAHPETGDEYALARTENKTGSGYKGFEVHAGPDVTLEQDLKRRDLTINAMAMDEKGSIVDPFNGLGDLQQGLLKHVSDAFVEDPVRLLRIARFASVLGHIGFHVAHPTFKLMKQMSLEQELKALKPERIHKEMLKALTAQQPWPFFKLLGKCGALDILLPGSNRWVNGDLMQHGEDAVAIKALKRCVGNTEDVDVRLAVLMFEAVTKGQINLSGVLPLTRSGKALMDLLPMLEIDKLMSASAEDLEAFFSKTALYKNSPMFEKLLQVAFAWYPQHDVWLKQLMLLAKQLTAVDSEEILAQGYTGKEIGLQLKQKRLEIIRQALVNL